MDDSAEVGDVVGRGDRGDAIRRKEVLRDTKESVGLRRGISARGGGAGGLEALNFCNNVSKTSKSTRQLPNLMSVFRLCVCNFLDLGLKPMDE